MQISLDKVLGSWYAAWMGNRSKEEVLLRIEQRSCVEPNNGCWWWTGNTTEFGYGQITYQGRLFRIHRLVWELVKGPIPEGMFVLHKCDNKVCWRPEHLYIGDASDNAIDREMRPTAKTLKARTARRLEIDTDGMKPHEIRILFFNVHYCRKCQDGEGFCPRGDNRKCEFPRFRRSEMASPYRLRKETSK